MIKLRKKTKVCTVLWHLVKAFETRYPGGETYVFFNNKGGMSVQKPRSMVARSKKHCYMKYNASWDILKINRKVKYPEEEEWVTDQLSLHCNTGILISMEYLMKLLRHHVVCEKLFDVMLKSSKGPAQKHSQQWLWRAVLKSNFVYRVESISQNIPVD